MLVGGGKMGLSHLAIVNSLPDTRISCVVDRSPFIRFIYRRLGFAAVKSLENNDRVLETADAVLIASPTVSHYPLALTCVQAGLPFFVEKPLTNNYETSLDLANRPIEKGIPAIVGYVNRFNSSFARCREIIADGRLGSVTKYDNTMLGAVANKKSVTSDSWRFDTSRGGGCLLDYGPHALDLGQYLFGSYDQVTKSSLQRKYSSKADDIVDASLVHANGIRGDVLLDWSRSDVRKANNEISIDLEGARVKVTKELIEVESDVEAAELEIDRGKNIIRPTISDSNVFYYLRGEEFSRQLEYFLAAVTQTETDGYSAFSAATLHDGAEVDRIISEIQTRSSD